MYIIQKRPGDQIKLGRKGEYNARRIALDLSAWQTRYGDNGTVQLIYQRPGDATPYPVTLTREDHLAIWTVAATDTANSGNSGRAELRYYIDDALVKSAISQVVVEPSLGEPGDAPDEEQQSWLEQAVQAGSTAQNSAANAANSAQSAQSSAESATNAAQSAQNSAAQASASAQSIQTSAETAANSANSAEASAQSAAVYAQTAQNAANQSTTSAGGAEASAQSSAASAQSAQSAAETASNSAQSAQSAAETAANSAQSAQSAAETAANSAQSAQSAAETAANSAQSAQTSAESAAASASAAEQASAALDTLIDDTVVTPDTIWSSQKIIENLCREFWLSSSGNSVTVSNPVSGSLLRVSIKISAKPTRTGTPTPNKSIPLQGWSSTTLTHTDDTNSVSYDFDFGCTVYGGKLDCVTGLLTIKHKIQYFDGTEDWQTRSDGSLYHPILPIDGISPNPDRSNRYDEMCSHYVFRTGANLDSHYTGICTTGDGIEIYNPSYTKQDPTAWKEYLSSLNTNGDPLHVVVRLNEPYTIQLEPVQIFAFAGTNSLQCTAGNPTVVGKEEFRYELLQISNDVIQLKSDMEKLKSDVAALQS